MERKYNAISLRNVNYSESDKIVTLLTLERGKIVMRARGCRNAKAKLRLAVSPLCFGKYILNESKGKFLLTGCDIIDSFECVAEDIDKYYVSMIILEAANKFSEEGVADKELFLLVLESLKNLCYGESPKIEGLVFLINLIEKLGYALSVGEGFWFDYENGRFVKESTNEAQKLSDDEKKLLSLVIEKQKTAEMFGNNHIKKIYLLLDSYLIYVTQKRFVTLKEYVSILL